MGKDIFFAGLTKEEILDMAKQKRGIKRLDKYRDALSVAIQFMIKMQKRVSMILEGRDASGKGHTLKRGLEYVPPTLKREVALGIPTAEEREEEAWFERYSVFLPEGRQVLTVFDRSWYNRMLVEAVMGFCTKEEYDWFVENVIDFEVGIQKDPDIVLIKVYLSVSKKEQERRLEGRSTKIRKMLKKSSIDEDAIKKRREYTVAKRRMLKKTDRVASPWFIVDSNTRFDAVIEFIKLIINAHPEVRAAVEKKIKIDLEPNPKRCRTGKRELANMQAKGVGKLKPGERDSDVFPWKKPGEPVLTKRVRVRGGGKIGDKAKRRKEAVEK